MSQEIAQLVQLITSSAKAIEAEFAAASPDAPVIPSLNSTDTHPLDLTPLKTLREQLRILDGACAQLRATVTPPICTIVDRAFGVVCERACLEVAVECKIADLLRSKPEGIHVNELGKATGIGPGKLGRVMRYLTTTHMFQEVRQDVFANNRLSIQLLEEHVGYAMMKFSVVNQHIGGCKLLETLLDPVAGPSNDAKDAPTCRANNWSRSIFEQWNHMDGGEKEAQLFGRFMTAFGHAIAVQAVAIDYPWQNLPPGSIVCDIGSGIGTVALELAKSRPQLKLILQDLPDVLKYAEDTIWPNECPQALQEKRVRFQPIDFFTESPVPNCDVYFMKAIMHDWNDEACVKILKNVRKVMKPGSKLLINEHLLRPALSRSAETHSEDTLDNAPAPLLRNTGAGRLRLYNLDISLLIALNSKERFLHEYTAIAQDAGLKLTGIHDVGDANVLEFMVSP